MNSVRLLSVTNITILLCSLVFVIDGSFVNSALMFGLNFLFVEYNFFWQPLSTMFMHATLMHIVMNMVILFQFGTLIEQTYGPKILFLLFFIGGVMTSLASFAYIYIFNMTSHNIVGASGAISVLIGFVAFVDKTKTKVMLIWVLAISFLPLLMGLNIAWYSHLAGFGIGYIAGSKAEKKYLDI